MSRPRILCLLSLLAVIAAVRHWPLLVPGQVVLDSDLLLIHQPTFSSMEEAWEDGSAVPFWNRRVFSGSPAFGIPDKPFLYPPVWLFLWLFGTVEAFRLLIVLHAVLGAWGMFILSRRLSRSDAGAFAAALLYLLGLQMVRLYHGLPFWGYAAAWMPWIAWATHRALEEERPVPWSICVGGLLALQIHAGGISIFFYTLLLLAGIVLLAPSPHGRWRRGVRVFAVAGLAGFGLAAVRLLPSMAWVGLTDRRGGLGLDLSRGEALDGAHMTLQQFPISFLVLLVLGLAAWRSQRRRLLAYGAVTFVAVVLATGALHPLLYEWLPGYGRTRHVVRARMLYEPLILVMGAVGIGSLMPRLLTQRWLAGSAARIIAGTAALGLVFWDLGMGDVAHFDKVARTRVASVMTTPRTGWPDGERIRSGAAGFRIHGDEPWDIPRIHPLDLESTQGKLGYVQYAAYSRALGRGLKRAAHDTLRVLACESAVLWEPLPGLGREPVSVIPRKGNVFQFQARAQRKDLTPSAEQGIWPVPDPMPHAALMARAVSVVARPGEHPEADLLALPQVDPAVAVLVRTPSGGDAKRFDAVVEGSPDRAVLRRVYGAGGEGMRELEVRIVPDGLDVALDGGEGWVRLAETFALYPGWSARVDGQEARVALADGIVTAVHVPQGSRRLELRYVPPGWRLGSAITLATLLVLAAAGVRYSSSR